MELIYPMFAMIVLTMIVGLITAYTRIKSAKTGLVDPRYFYLISGYEIPRKIEQLGKNFDNLFQVPMLFYAVGILAITLQLSNGFLLLMAWLFVALRCVHSFIHMTYNHPMHRFVPFLLSFFCVFSMWVNLVLAIS